MQRQGRTAHQAIGAIRSLALRAVNVRSPATGAIASVACLVFPIFIWAQQAGKDPARQNLCSQVTSLQFQGLTGPNSEDAEEHYSRALQSEHSGDEVTAEKELRAALAERPQEGSYVRKLSLLYIEKRRYDEATKVITDYANLCGPTALGYGLKGELLFQQKEYDRAYEVVRRSLELSDNDGRMHELLGLIHIVVRQYPSALPELEKAAALDPNQPQIRYYCGRVLYTLGRYTEARDQLLSCLQLAPGYPRALENLGLCYEALRDYARATRAYLDAIGLEKGRTMPKHGEPYAFYGAMLVKLGESEKALPILREGVAVAPNSFAANYELGRALLKVGQLQEADGYLLAAAQLGPKFSRTYFLLGELRKKQNRLPEANRYWALFGELNSVEANRDFPLTDQ